MPKAYWISAYSEISDPAKLKAYGELAGPAVAAYGGRVLVRGGQLDALEGAPKQRCVVLEFPSMEAAQACYRSPEYTAAHAKLEDGAVRDLFVVEALDGV